MTDTWLIKCPDCPSARIPNAPMLLRELCGECAAMSAQRHLEAFPGHRVTVHPPVREETRNLLGRKRR